MRQDSRWLAWARGIKTETCALYFAVRDERTPWYAKLLGVCVVAYALSPIDLIPDFIPVIGYLDDLLIVPLGLWLVRYLIPAEVLSEARRRAAGSEVRHSLTAAIFVLFVWLFAGIAAAVMVWRLVR
jgi:uncharacterized membrane protein YkvA (DUF1232 family)